MEGEASDVVVDFTSFELDPRLTRVLQKNNIIKPTLIQEKAIPLALAGKDILAKAKTGSGKTLAYLLPILQRILTTETKACRCLILVPTKELARQVNDTLVDLLHYCPKALQGANLAGDESVQLQKSMLAACPTIVISTPSRILPHLESKSLTLTGSLEFLVIDEADLVLSFGYSSDVQRLTGEFIPKTVQTFLMSATLSAEVESLKQLVLRNPVTLKLEEADEEEPSKLHQYVIRCEEDDKFLLMYVTLKLKLLKGKLLIFANDVERCFKLKLFLEQFGVKTCLLNPELPLASRHHIVDEFNRGVYDIIIASDLQTSSSATAGGVSGSQAKKKSRKDSREGGVARGVDFKRVDVVINFDLPLRIDSYVHRVGRTARGGEVGTAISFVCSSGNEAILKLISADQMARGNEIVPHEFDLSQLDGFRYRCGDALRAVTKASIKTARLQAVKDEIIKSEKLKTFFEERPKDLLLLRHDNNMGVVKQRPHLKHIPGYLLATDSVPSAGGDGSSGAAGKRAKLDPLPQAEREHGANSFSRKKSKSSSFRRSKNPLKSIKKRK